MGPNHYNLMLQMSKNPERHISGIKLVQLLSPNLEMKLGAKPTTTYPNSQAIYLNNKKIFEPSQINGVQSSSDGTLELAVTSPAENEKFEL